MYKIIYGLIIKIMCYLAINKIVRKGRNELKAVYKEAVENIKYKKYDSKIIEDISLKRIEFIKELTRAHINLVLNNIKTA